MRLVQEASAPLDGILTYTYLIQLGEVVSEEDHRVTGSLHAQLYDALFEQALYFVLLTVRLACTNRVFVRTLTGHLHVSSG